MQTVSLPAQSEVSDDLLDDLLNESTQHAADVFSLDDLLGESLALRTAIDEEKILRKRVNQGQMGQEEMTASMALLRKWELAREWTKAGYVMAFTRQRCDGCGEFHSTFDGFFELHTHVRKAETTRLIAVNSIPDETAEKFVRYSDSAVPLCHQCADFSGWPLEE